MPTPRSVLTSDPANPWVSWDYVSTHVPELLAAGREHVLLTVSSVLLAVAVSLPLAVFLRRYRMFLVPVLTVSGVLYTIPSLALISLLWPVFGLSPLTVVIALALYALLVVLRNALVGLDGVDPMVVDAARGMGMSAGSIFFRVELPLALPAIISGVRIATVSTVGLVTIGALVGYGGFGGLIVSGFQQNFWHAQIFTATVGCVLLATVFDVLLHWGQKRSAPWERGRTA